ncbi:Uncharacterized protein conserved in archaea [Vibrio owensii]|uniref:DUF2202 domain-containing protein n=1 Tax=Vibrio owensii TaxID=696485 RepID=UPI0003A44D53|nr:DUF2202 domain-containing protein [Vibrio owensii]SUQ07812.1 Uncharacterized protein conserved in archaea [Vibrio owensii]
MKISKIFVTVSVLLSITSTDCFSKGGQGFQKNKPNSDREVEAGIDDNERLHLIFMREGEKLARDVYINLSMEYPDVSVFGITSNSEALHTSKVLKTLNRFNIDDPVINDNVGVFSSKEFGQYFTEKYQKLTDAGAISELDALYVGALIEEFDMKEIKGCPQVMIDTVESIDTVKDCGLVYTDNRAISSLYDYLLKGSEKHLRAYIRNIEKYIGEGAYHAQEISQSEVNEILGR